MRVVLTSPAEEDLGSIFRAIAADRPAVARAFTRALLDACLKLGDFPESHPLLDRFAQYGVRRHTFRGHLLIYWIVQDRVEILRILHGSRDYPDLVFST